MRKKFRFYHDPGHGWLAVKFKELEYLGVEKEISEYSYVKGKTVYLEEDSDADVFIRAYKHLYGELPQIVETYHERTPIRGYRHYGRIVTA